MSSVNKKELQNHLSQPYNYIITEVNDESGKYFVAKAPELDGLIGTGNTYEEAYNDIKEAMVSYVETKLAKGIEV